MYHVKMAFVLIQVGSNLWINPMQIEGVSTSIDRQCPTVILASNQVGERCSDWPIEKVREALTPAAVAKALEGK